MISKAHVKPEAAACGPGDRGSEQPGSGSRSEGIVLATLPHADTKCLTASLVQSLGYSIGPSLFEGSFTKNRAVPEIAARYATDRLVGGWHLSGHTANLRALHDAGLTRLVLHLRDPRSAAIIAARLRHAKENPGTVDASQPLERFRAPSDAPSFDHHLHRFLEKANDWLTDWLAAIESDGPLRILVRSHEQLVSDEKGYFASLFAFYSVQPDQLVVAPKNHGLIFGRRCSEDWREALTSAQLESLRGAIPERLLSAFGWRP